jgi:uncharacterized protein (TIGR00162 family)
MEKIRIVRIADIELNEPILIEGLPGIGHVGKLVAEHIIDELGAKKIIEVYSTHFPPQVLVLSDGTVRLVKCEFYAVKYKDLDLLILVGDHQSATNEGHYELTDAYLEIAKQYGVTRIYTLGGYGLGQLVEKPAVLGAVNNKDLVDEMKGYGVVFKENEPGGGIIGASGLLLGLGGLVGIDAVCLMGETSGYLVDPKSAQAVMSILSTALNLDINMQALEERAKEMEKIAARLREMEQMGLAPGEVASEEDLRYIG